MNDLQKETIKELQKILPQSHFVNIKVRIDGEWREYEADFLKEILAGQVKPVVKPACEMERPKMRKLLLIDSLQGNTKNIDGKWVVARPENFKYRTLKQKLYECWQVFIGKAEAIRFYKQ